MFNVENFFPKLFTTYYIFTAHLRKQFGWFQRKWMKWLGGGKHLRWSLLSGTLVYSPPLQIVWVYETKCVLRHQWEWEKECRLLTQYGTSGYFTTWMETDSGFSLAQTVFVIKPFMMTRSLFLRQSIHLIYNCELGVIDCIKFGTNTNTRLFFFSADCK